MKLVIGWIRALMLAAALAVGAGGAAAQAPPGAAGARDPIATPVPDDPDRLQVPSFQRGSGTRAGGPANELNTGDRRATDTLPGGSAAAAMSGRLYHGNYCGKGERSGHPAPTDELDAVCFRHDRCYDAARRPSCACDVTMRREAVAVANRSDLSRELRARAATVAQTASALICESP